MGIHVGIEHRTSYRFDRAVQIHPHVLRLRPAPHCRTPILAYSLQVSPGSHFLNWQQDPFGNFMARLVFPEPADHLEVTVDLVADLTVVNPFDFFVDDAARTYPFAYPGRLGSDLEPYRRMASSGQVQLDDWSRRIAADAADVAPVPRGSAPSTSSSRSTAASQPTWRTRSVWNLASRPPTRPSAAASARAGTARGSWSRRSVVWASPPASSRATWCSSVPMCPRSMAPTGPPPTSPTSMRGPRSTCPAPAGSVWTRRRVCSRGRVTSRWRARPTPRAPRPSPGSTGPTEVTFEFANVVHRVREDPARHAALQHRAVEPHRTHGARRRCPDGRR